jgi:hypothetical protein
MTIPADLAIGEGKSIAVAGRLNIRSAYDRT